MLLAFGLQWLRKAILRSSGYKPLHDEDEAFRRQREAGRRRQEHEQRAGLDWYSFTVAFKGVLLEGLEVVFIVISFGSAQGRLGLAAAGAAAALVLVVVAGVLARGPLERVPENTIKFAVGLLLTSFGCFWGAEGAGVHWPGDELSLLAVVGVHRGYVVRACPVAPPPAPGARSGGGQGVKYLRSFGLFWWNFIVGDDWRVAAGLAVALGLTSLLTHEGVNAWWLLPIAIVAATHRLALARDPAKLVVTLV